MILTLILLFLILALIFLFSIYLNIILKKRKIGILGDILYKDTPKEPGIILYSKTLPLVGKPDYLVRVNNMILPIEVKTGKTPKYPHKNHIIQLMAYCLLVEENYNQRPSHGIISYPDKHFTLDYLEVYKSTLMNLVKEIQDYKQDKKTFDFNAIKEELCKNCRLEINQN